MMCGVTGHTRTCEVTHACCCLISLCLAILSLLIYPLLPTSRQAHAQGETATIQITGPTQPPGFFPDVLAVHVFDYVIFANQSTPPTSYSLSTDDGTIASPAIAPGKQWSVTFTNPGAYEYHDGASPAHMVGEIIVVASSVALLPTPAPEIYATAIALVQAGKALPDNLSQLAPTPTPLAKRASVPSQVKGPWPGTTPLLIVESGLLLLLLILGSILFIRNRLRRSKKRTEKSDEENPPAVAAPDTHKRRFPWPKRKKKEEDDEDDEDENE